MTRPTQLGKLGVVGMEHILPRIFVGKFQDPALRLGLHDRIGVLAGRQAGTGRVIVEEIGMQVKTS